MTREELIKSLTLLKEQARNSLGNTYVWDIKIDSFNFVIDSAIQALEQEPKTGHWIRTDNWLDVGIRCKCSECGQVFVLGDQVSRNYCGNCGAKMDKGGRSWNGG